MTVLLVLFMLVTFLAADFAVQKVRYAKLRKEARVEEAIPFRLPDGVCLAPNHTWIKDENGVTTIGLDEFLGRIIGAVGGFVIPEVGAMVAPTSTNIRLREADRGLQLASPVAGRILEVNSSLLRNPALAHRDPYGRGWLLKIAPERKGMPGFLSGESARRWLKEQMALAKDFLAVAVSGPRLAMSQDGGEPVMGLLRQCNPAVWKEFEKRFVTMPESNSTTV